MDLQGNNFIGDRRSAEGKKTFSAYDPVSGAALEPAFHQATDAELDAAMELAAGAFTAYAGKSPEQIADFLEAIAVGIMALGDPLLHRARQETGLPEPRLIMERGRTTGQLGMFAALVREGSWLEARIDRAQPERKPMPRADLRRKLVPVGPVVVFGASNFPLAFSVAGGDTASALAAGNPVVVKAHPAHPGISELVASVVAGAAAKCGLPPGVFSLVQGADPEVSLRLVRHPAAKAVGFTGSLRGGRALFDAASARPEPIPVFAEMGSVNPVFILSGALQERGTAIAEGLVQSVTLGVGQFCTNPGLVFTTQNASVGSFLERAATCATAAPPGVMLHAGIARAFQEGSARWQSTTGVRLVGQSATAAQSGQASALVFTTDGATFDRHPDLREELFGPATLVVTCADSGELLRQARSLPGQLTATILGTEADLAANAELVAVLTQKVGRLIFNQFPTGVEVVPAMQHGGPYPATTAPQSTSVGTAAISRWTRPVCYQNFPDSALPPELQNGNPRGIWRLLDGKQTREAF